MKNNKITNQETEELIIEVYFMRHFGLSPLELEKLPNKKVALICLYESEKLKREEIWQRQQSEHVLN